MNFVTVAEIAAGVYLAFVIRAVVRFIALELNRHLECGRKFTNYFL